MATVIREVRYRCSNDCQPSGCPGHVAELCYQSTADHYSFALPDRQIAFERGELEAVLDLLRSLNRHDAVEVPAQLQPGEGGSKTEQRARELLAIELRASGYKNLTPPSTPPAKESVVKVEVTEDMRDAGSSQYSPDCSWRDNVEMAFAAMLAHPDCQRQLRDMVLAAVPTGPEHFYIGIDEVEKFRAETLANIIALFDKENGNER